MAFCFSQERGLRVHDHTASDLSRLVPVLDLLLGDSHFEKLVATILVLQKAKPALANEFQ
jgi:hypothetical protein